jgi:tetratricopeptide (TPR) repeat protein
MYLPLVGALWPIAAVLVYAGRRVPRAAAIAAALALAIALCATSWHAIGYYNNDLAMTARMATLYSQYPRMRLAHADALYRAGRTCEALTAAEALTDVQEVEDAGVASEAWQVIGRARARLGDDVAALSAFRQAVAIKPESGLARARFGGALRRTGRIEEALSELERAAELAPLYNPGLHELARAYREVGWIADERRVYAQIETNNPYDIQAAVRLAEHDIAAGDLSAALPRLEQALKLIPDDARVRALYAWAQFLTGDWKAAADQIERISQHNRDEPLARVVAVGVALSMEKHQEAIALTIALADGGLLEDPSLFDAFAAVVQSCAERRPSDPWPYYVMAVACQATDRDQAARMAAEAFKQRTQDKEWHRRIDEIVRPSAQAE